jgi:hypothetical protein
MAFKHRYADGWYKNAAGLYVQMEPISAALVAAASVGDAVTVAADGTLECTTISGGGGGSSAPLTPDTLPSSADAMDDEFDSGSTINTSLWTAVNATNLTDSIVQGALVLSIAGANAAVQQRGYVQTLPVAASWTFETKVMADGDVDTSSFEAGLWLRESGTGKLLSLHVGYSGGPLIWTSRWTAPGTFGATINTFDPTASPANAGLSPIRRAWYLRVSLSGSNYLCQYSPNGWVWTTLSTVALTTPFTTAADQVGIKCYNDAAGNSTPYGVFEHFRRIS